MQNVTRLSESGSPVMWLCSDIIATSVNDDNSLRKKLPKWLIMYELMTRNFRITKKLVNTQRTRTVATIPWNKTLQIIISSHVVKKLPIFYVREIVINLISKIPLYICAAPSGTFFMVPVAYPGIFFEGGFNKSS